ncbi:MAG: hypothetical protein PHH37_14395 [Paludibacter sp.]|nr:hypothetical protein [Paludibacter sp.]
MNKNNFFSFNRFGLLLRNDILLNYKQYLLMIPGAFLAGYVILYLNMPTNQYARDFYPSTYGGLFIVCLIGLGAFIGLGFPSLNSKTGAQNYLLIPCSTFEKFLSQFIIRIVIGTALFFVLFYIDALLARVTALQVLSRYESHAQIPVFQYSYLFYNMNEDQSLIKDALFLFFVSLGMYLFSVRLYFTKIALLKTILTLAASIIIIMLTVFGFSHLFYPGAYGLDVHLNHYKIYNNYDNFDIFMFTILSVPWLFFLPLGYFKLKEKQI